MLSAEELESRQQQIAASDDLTALLQRLSQRAAPLLQRMPPLPPMKAVLTADGGFCPDDGTRLEFDPWSPVQHRCPHCGRSFEGERHDAAWAHYQHLWLAERAVHLATVGILGNRRDASDRANELLQAYRNYADYPNRDNVLGPSHLFFSTYLESIWLGNYLSAAILLREAGQLSEDTAGIVNAIADESAGVIGEFDEGLSNRQTWHNAALASVAVWFEDEELATRVIEGPSGILTHLLQGFGSDGMWYEGDNYHLFALRGQLLAMAWARQAGVDMMAEPKLASRIAAALRAPALTALPDFTFPARKDSRFGVSLAQPMYLELWEVGLGRLTEDTKSPADLWDWLEQVYRSPAPVAQTFDSYLQEAGEEPPKRPRTRADLSWWSLLEMVPALPSGVPRWAPKSTLLEGQGLAVLRSEDRYVSLECGGVGGGHGHADRLNLVLHANGEYWLPDFGTGSYVSRDLFWYRSTLAHNAPRLDSVSQPRTDAACDSFEDTGSWAWVRGRWGDVTRTLVTGPSYILDVVELTAEGHVLELPLHLSGETQVESPGEWQSDHLPDEFAQGAERFVSAAPGNVMLRSCGSAGTTMRVFLAGDGELLRARGPGTPGKSVLVPFYLLRASGRSVRLVTVLEPTSAASSVRGVEVEQNAVSVDTVSGVDRHVATASGWQVQTGTTPVRLGGARQQVRPFEPVVQVNR
ncbi:MAG TPA: heparinase II/III family protein, partial [Gemmatimonadales bacterium]|nr:heparinase II/III family protein [Gemmatimonadales bacterium]